MSVKEYNQTSSVGFHRPLIRPFVINSRLTGLPRLLPLLGALLLFTLQLLSGTDPIYAILVLIFCLLSYIAVRWAGGLTTLPGLIIVHFVLQHVLLSQIAKVFFWETADTTLRQPVATMGVYVIGMASIVFGVFLAQRYVGRKSPQRKPLFQAKTEPRWLLLTCILSTILATISSVLFNTSRIDSGSGEIVQGGILGPFFQIGCFGALAVACGTAYYIKISHGRRSFGLANAVPIIVLFSIALLRASREQMTVPLIVYVLTCFAFQYRFRVKHIVIAVIGMLIATYILFPFALLARGSLRQGRIDENITRSASMIMELIENPLQSHEQVTTQEEKTHTKFRYFNKSSFTLDRYALILWTDAMVDATFRSGTTGMYTITPGFEQLLPRMFYPDKPSFEIGNWLAHREPGLMQNRHDVTTGITVGFFADAFSSFEWIGIALTPAIIIFLLIVVYSFFIDLRLLRNVYALSLILQLTWGFSEETIHALILNCLQMPLASAFGFFFLIISVELIEQLCDRLASNRGGSNAAHRQPLQRLLESTSARRGLTTTTKAASVTKQQPL